MSANVCLDVVAFALACLLFAAFRTKRRTGLESYRCYYITLLSLIVYIFLEGLTALYVLMPSTTQRMSPVVVYGANASYLFVELLFMTLFTRYLLAMAESSSRRISKGRMMLVYWPLLPFLAIVTAAAVKGGGLRIGLYEMRREPLTLYSLYLFTAYYMILTVWTGIRHHAAREKLAVIHVAVANLIIMMGFSAQQGIQGVRFAPFVASLCMTDMLFTVLKPEEVYDASDAMRKEYLLRFTAEDYGLGKSFAVFLIWVHDFNVVRESLGRQEADFLMKQVADFAFYLREGCTVFREDKDVLAVRIHNVDRKEAERLKREIEQRFESIWRLSMAESMLSADVMLLLCPEDVPDMDSFRHLLKNYDSLTLATYASASVESLLGEDKEEQMLEAVKRGLRDKSFEVFYQPIYSTKEKRISAAEALIRLFDPEYGFVPPEDMIKLAEREGYILEIGETVLRKVCSFYMDNHLDEKGIDYIEVNLSAVQCAKNRLAEEFLGIMREYGLDTAHINFEITETSAMISDNSAVDNINCFEKHGVSLSLDDYGTGYSNISYLYNIPFAIVKMDRSILWSSEKNKKAEVVLKNAYSMAKRLHIHVVQEGVETEEQIKKLLELQCDYFQGYYFSKPVKEEDFLRYIENFELPEILKDASGK